MVSKTMSLAALADPLLNLLGRRLGEFSPALLDPAEDFLFLDIPFLEQKTDLLLHRAALLCCDFLEPFDDRFGDAANRQGCHVSILLIAWYRPRESSASTLLPSTR